jgi:flagellum-specific ATP synthase
VAGAVTTPDQRADAGRLRRLLAAHRDVRELVEIGAYVPGTNPDADTARALWPAIGAFLTQDLDSRCTAEQAWSALADLVRTGETIR